MPPPALPLPQPRDAAASAVMRANRRRDTQPELALRRELHRRGMRFRVDHPVLVAGGRAVRPDVVFTSARVAVFVDGCFWHGCPEHLAAPKHNSAYWTEKLRRNRERDARDSARLAGAGWIVVRVWEHVKPTDAADEVERRVRPGQSAAAART